MKKSCVKSCFYFFIRTALFNPIQAGEAFANVTLRILKLWL